MRSPPLPVKNGIINVATTEHHCHFPRHCHTFPSQSIQCHRNAVGSLGETYDDIGCNFFDHVKQRLDIFIHWMIATVSMRIPTTKGLVFGQSFFKVSWFSKNGICCTWNGFEHHWSIQEEPRWDNVRWMLVNDFLQETHLAFGNSAPIDSQSSGMGRGIRHTWFWNVWRDHFCMKRIGTSTYAMCLFLFVGERQQMEYEWIRVDLQSAQIYLEDHPNKSVHPELQIC